MRLVSKHHDYYDGAVRSTANDKSLVFVRNTHELPDRKKVSKLSGTTLYFDEGEVRLTGAVIGFCGQVFQCFHVCPDSDYTRRVGTKELYVYSYDELAAVLPMDKQRSPIRRSLREGSSSFPMLLRWFVTSAVKKSLTARC